MRHYCDEICARVARTLSVHELLKETELVFVDVLLLLLVHWVQDDFIDHLINGLRSTWLHNYIHTIHKVAISVRRFFDSSIEDLNLAFEYFKFSSGEG